MNPKNQPDTPSKDLLKWLVCHPDAVSAEPRRYNTVVIQCPTRTGAEIDTMPTWAIMISNVSGDNTLLTACITTPNPAWNPHALIRDPRIFPITITRWVETFSDFEALEDFFYKPSTVHALGMREPGIEALMGCTCQWSLRTLDSNGDEIFPD